MVTLGFPWGPKVVGTYLWEVHPTTNDPWMDLPWILVRGIDPKSCFPGGVWALFMRHFRAVTSVTVSYTLPTLGFHEM